MSPPPFYTKRHNRILKMTRFKLLPKRKQRFNRKGITDRSKFTTSLVQNPALPHYSSVTPSPNFLWVHVLSKTKLKARSKFFPKRITPFLCQFFSLEFSDFQSSFERTAPLTLWILSKFSPIKQTLYNPKNWDPSFFRNNANNGNNHQPPKETNSQVVFVFWLLHQKLQTNLLVSVISYHLWL